MVSFDNTIEEQSNFDFEFPEFEDPDLQYLSPPPSNQEVIPTDAEMEMEILCWWMQKR
jgi:hypothetical protein